MKGRAVMTLDDILEALRKAIKRAGSQRAVAEAIGVSPAYLNDILNYRRAPGITVLRWLGLRRRNEPTTYERLTAPPPEE